MSELRALTVAARELRDRKVPFVSATVVAVRGSGYRKAGGRMIATQDQWLAGSISGGCLERDVTARGFWYTRNERARVITYNQSVDALDERSGTGCQGVVDVLVEKHVPDLPDEADVFAAAERCIRDETVAVVLTVTRSAARDIPVGTRLVLQANRWRVPAQHSRLLELLGREALRALAGRPSPYLVERDEIAVLVECIVPPPHLFVFGTGPDASPLVALAKQLGWSASVWDASPHSAARERFQLADHYLTGSLAEAVSRMSRSARGAAIVMSHHFARDSAAVQALLAGSARYVGVLGPRVRTDEMLAECRAAGVVVDAAALARLYAPAGLRVGAQTPAEIALAIVAEVQDVVGRLG
jgi:xanthine dehydrogenase accessory factor